MKINLTRKASNIICSNEHHYFSCFTNYIINNITDLPIVNLLLVRKYTKLSAA